MVKWPACTVITVNWNGKQHLADCLPSVLALDYPKKLLEVIVVDNASTDGSVDFLRKSFPSVRVVETGANLGFAGGNNAGVKHAKGEIIALINSDARADPGWLKALVEPLVSGSKKLVATSCLSTGWDGTGVDAPVPVSILGVATGYPVGLKKAEDYLERRPVLLPAGNGCAIRKKAFVDAGGFDDDFFMYLEDVDLGWRFWLMGYEILHIPEARIWHKGTGSRKEAMSRLYAIAERNALFVLIKNLEDETLARLLPAALWVKIQRFLSYANVDIESYKFGKPRDPRQSISVNSEAFTPIVGAVQALELIEKMFAKRAKIQKMRKRSDKEIFKLFDRPFDFQSFDKGSIKLQHSMLSAMGWDIRPLQATPEELRGLHDIIDKQNRELRGVLRKYEEQEQRHNAEVKRLLEWSEPRIPVLSHAYRRALPHLRRAKSAVKRVVRR